MSIKGSLSEASFSDVLQLIAFSNKAGCLSVTDGKNFGNVFIKDNGIIYANLINRRDRLGDVLVSQKKITEGILEDALTKQRKEKKRLGEVLIEMSAITRQDLDYFLKYQIEEVVHTMLTWETGYFSFEPELLPPAEEFSVFISPEEVLLEGARRIGEWKRLEGKMPPAEIVLKAKSLDKSLNLTDKEKRVLSLINGQRSLDEILKLSEFDFFETSRIVYGLLSAGILEKPEAAPVEKPRGNVEEFKNLGYAFFKTEMYDEAQREYRKILEIEPSSSEGNFYLGLIEMRRENWSAALTLLQASAAKEKRANVLNNIGIVLERLDIRDEALKYFEQALGVDPKNKKALLNLGRHWYRLDEFSKARDCFMRALETDDASYESYCYLPLVFFKLDDRNKAVEYFQAGRDKFPQGVELLINFAVLSEGTGKPEEAEKIFRRVLEVSPNHAVARRKLANFYYVQQLFGAAKEEYEKVPDAKRDFEVYLRLGEVYLKQGDRKKALALWEKAYELNPEDQILVKNLEILRSASNG